jgi:hypothetical protein
MRKFKFLLTLVLAFCFAATVFGSPNSSRRETNFETFWAKFKNALAKNDKNAVFANSRLPISMPTFQKNVRTKKDFLRRYNHIFNGEADAAKCFQTAAPQKVSAKRYEVACGFKADTNGDAGEPIVYSFELTKAGWKFVGLDNINE